MDLDKDLVEFSLIESQILQNEVALNELNALSKETEVGFNKADIMTLETLAGESIVTESIDLSFFGSIRTQTGAELAGEGLLTAIKDGAVKLAKAIFSLISRLFGWVTGSFSKKREGKTVYGGQVGEGTRVPVKDAEQAVVENILKDNGSEFMAQVLTSDRLHKAFADYAVEAETFTGRFITLVDHFEDYLKSSRSILGRALDNKKRIFEHLASRGDLDENARKDNLDDLRKLVTVSHVTSGNGHLSKLKDSFELYTVTREIRAFSPNLPKDFKDLFPSVKNAYKKVSKGNLLSTAVYQVLADELTKLNSESTRLKPEDVSYARVKELVANNSAILTNGLKLFNLESSAQERVEELSDKYEEVRESLKMLVKASGKKDTEFLNVFKAIEETHADLLSDLKNTAFGFRSLVMVYMRYADTMKIIKAHLEANPKL